MTTQNTQTPQSKSSSIVAPVAAAVQSSAKNEAGRAARKLAESQIAANPSDTTHSRFKLGTVLMTNVLQAIERYGAVGLNLEAARKLVRNEVERLAESIDVAALFEGEISAEVKKLEAEIAKKTAKLEAAKLAGEAKLAELKAASSAVAAQ